VTSYILGLDVRRASFCLHWTPPFPAPSDPLVDSTWFVRGIRAIWNLEERRGHGDKAPCVPRGCMGVVAAMPQPHSVHVSYSMGRRLDDVDEAVRRQGSFSAAVLSTAQVHLTDRVNGKLLNTGIIVSSAGYCTLQAYPKVPDTARIVGYRVKD
jgi:hypothetical protein